MFNGNDPQTQALLAALSRGGLQQPTERRRSPIVQAMMAQMMTQQSQPHRISSYGQLAAELGTALLQKGLLDKERAVEATERQRNEQVQREIARSLIGGGNPANAQATDPLMVQTTGQRLPDSQEALIRALSPEGGRAVQDNPMLQAMLKGEMQGPELLNVPAGGVILDPRTRKPVYENPVSRGEQSTTNIRDFEKAREGGYTGSFMDFLSAGRGTDSDRTTAIRELEYARRFDGYKGSLAEWLRSSKASGDFTFRAADANAFSRSSAEIYGGFYDPVTGQFSGLDEEKAAKAAGLAAKAARIYRDAEGDLSHNEAFMDAFSRIRDRNQPTEDDGALPDAAKHKGRRIRDNQTGKTLRSDGTRWLSE